MRIAALRLYLRIQDSDSLAKNESRIIPQLSRRVVERGTALVYICPDQAERTMEELLTRLEEILAGWLGGAVLAQTVSKLLLIGVTGLVFGALWMAVGRLFGYLDRKTDEWCGTRIQGLKIQRQRIMTEEDIARLMHGTVKWVRRALKAILLLVFINVIFVFFEWSREAAVAVIGGAALVVIMVVILLARVVVHLLKVVFDGIAAKRIRLASFYPEWAGTSYNLLRILVIALTLIIVFPYLPGSGSPAFQGVSIFLGVLLSLGSTSAVANVVAGIVITYTRAFKIGDRVKISGTAGDVIERSTFVTRIRTPKNVEVAIPNASVLSNHIINFSAQAKQAGLTLHTSVTIGYDVPWTKVHELLLDAAGKTERIEKDPAPFVLQTALNDFYVEYELNATTREPGAKQQTYSDLHAHILNAFNAAGVEIMSPHYQARRDGSAPALPPLAG
jgi:small-conductance mechanosensitive channel